MKFTYVIAGIATTAVALAQDKVDLTIQTSAKPMTFKIESKSDIDTKSTRLIDGEEFGGGGGRGGGRGGRGGGFGGGGPAKTAVVVEFDEGVADGVTWRQYRAAEAVVTRAGRDGEDQENTVPSALSGKKVFLISDDRGLIIREGSADGEELAEQLGTGVPTRIALEGLAPGKTVVIGEEIDLSKSFPAALKNLMHPIRAERAARGGAGGRQGGGQGGGQRGQRGGGRGGRGGGGVNDAAMTALVNDKVDTEVTAKLVEVIEKDGVVLAKVTFEGKMTGKGKPEDIGMAANAFGRGGRGGGGRGGGGAPQMEGKASITVAYTGTMLINTTASCLHELNLEGSLKSHSELSGVMSFGGEERELETTTDRNGTFSLNVACRPAQTK